MTGIAHAVGLVTVAHSCALKVCEDLISGDEKPSELDFESVWESAVLLCPCMVFMNANRSLLSGSLAGYIHLYICYEPAQTKSL